MMSSESPHAPSILGVALRRATFFPVPTRYRRVGVVLDPELGDALKLAASRLRTSTQAAQLRELALIGARSLGKRDLNLEQARKALDELGAIAEREDLLILSSRLRARRKRADETPSESLDWARGPR